MLSSDRIRGPTRFGKALNVIFPKLSSQNICGFDHATILSSSFHSLRKERLAQWPSFCVLKMTKNSGGYFQKNWEGCVVHFLKPLPYFRPKSVIFPTLFKTWSKIWYPISDLTLKSIHYLTPALQSVPEVKPVLKVMFIQSFELKGKWSYRLMMKN